MTSLILALQDKQELVFAKGIVSSPICTAHVPRTMRVSYISRGGTPKSCLATIGCCHQYAGSQYMIVSITYDDGSMAVEKQI